MMKLQRVKKITKIRFFTSGEGAVIKEGLKRYWQYSMFIFFLKFGDRRFLS